MATKYKLYTYFRSSCSARVRIAAKLKGIDLEYKFVHLPTGIQHSEDYTEINPSHSVPTLVVGSGDQNQTFIKQSVAILEFLEEAHPDTTRLLPPIGDPLSRAQVRDLVGIIAADVQPVTNLRILQRLKSMSVDGTEWSKHFISEGLRAFENVIKNSAGRYSVGDSVTLADVCLSPAVDGAFRVGVDVGQFPTVKRIYDEVQKLEEFQCGSWRSQPDTPEEFRPPSTKM